MEFYNKVVDVPILNVKTVNDEIKKLYENTLKRDPKFRKVLQVLKIFVTKLPDWMQKSLMITAKVGERSIIFQTSESQDDKFVINLNSGDSDETSINHETQSSGWTRRRDFWPKVGLLGVFVLAIAGGLGTGYLAFLGAKAALAATPSAVVAVNKVAITAAATAGLGTAGVVGALAITFDANSFIANGGKQLSIKN